MRIHCSAFAAVTATAATAALTLGPAATTASAVGPLVVCTGQETVSFSPALRNTPTDLNTTISGRFGTKGNPVGLCASVGAPTAWMTYDVPPSFTPGASCTQGIALNLPNTRTFVWNNGQTSAFSYTADRGRILGQTVLVFTGTITSGRFSGHAATETVAVADLNTILCATTGVTSATAQATVEIL